MASVVATEGVSNPAFVTEDNGEEITVDNKRETETTVTQVQDQNGGIAEAPPKEKEKEKHKEKKQKKEKTQRSKVKPSESPTKSCERLKAWKPYENAGAELPITSRLQPPSTFYKMRWTLVKTFHHRLFTFCSYTVTLGEFIVYPAIVLLFSLLMGFVCCDTDPTGQVASLAILFTFILSSKNSFITFLIGMSYERLLILHKFMACIALGASLVHGLTAEGEEDEEDGEEEDEEGGAILSGWIFTGLIIGIIVFGFYYFRRYFYDIFYKLHLVLALAIIVLAVIHGAGLAAIGGLFWLADYVIKAIVVALNYHTTKSCSIKRLPADVIQIRFKKSSFVYKSGQHVTLCVPKVSYFEWHAFSISSSPHEDVVTIHVRVLGDWTKRFHKLASELNEEEWTVFISGPFGMPDLHHDNDYRLFMLISGGIGVTPLQSVTNELLHQSSRGRKIYRMMFIWSVRDAHLITSVLDFDQKHLNENLPKNLPTSLQPDLIPHEEKLPCKLESYYHLTQVRDKDDFSTGNILPGDQKDVYFGRPHMSVYFEQMYETAKQEGESKVAVMCCGPTPLMTETEMQASLWSKDGIVFECHTEVFEY